MKIEDYLQRVQMYDLLIRTSEYKRGFVHDLRNDD